MELHSLVKEHRVRRPDYIIKLNDLESYNKVWYNFAVEYEHLLKLRFEELERGGGKERMFGFVLHQLYSSIYMLRYGITYSSESIRKQVIGVLDIYLTDLHKFGIEQNIDEFRVLLGYLQPRKDQESFYWTRYVWDHETNNYKIHIGDVPHTIGIYEKRIEHWKKTMPDISKSYEEDVKELKERLKRGV